MIGFSLFGLTIDALFIIYPIALFLIFMGYKFILFNFKSKTNSQLNHLLYETEQYDLYQLLLENKRLRWFFSKAELELLKLSGFLAESNDAKIMLQIKHIDQLNLNQKMKLDFMSKRFTYYVELGSVKQAQYSYEMLESLLKMKKHPEATKILNEASEVLQVYIKKNVRLISSLIQKADSEPNTIVQGVIYYRIAKLYYFDKKNNSMKTYLEKANKQLKGTYYEQIIKEALINPDILNTK